MFGTVVALVVAIITCLKFRGSCVAMFMEQKEKPQHLSSTYVSV